MVRYPPPWYLVSHRHICAIPHFATYRAMIVRYPIRRSTKEFCDTIATSIARYEKYRCWASKVTEKKATVRANFRKSSCKRSVLWHFAILVWDPSHLLERGFGPLARNTKIENIGFWGSPQKIGKHTPKNRKMPPKTPIFKTPFANSGGSLGA